MPNYFAKRDTTKVDSTKKGDIRFQSNLLDIVGETLIQSAQKGKFSSGPLQNFSADIDVDLGKHMEGLSLNLGYNKSIGPIPQNLRAELKWNIPVSKKR